MNWLIVTASILSMVQPDQASAYAIHASAASVMGNKRVAVESADWLLANSQPGWGTGREWDAFRGLNDGTMNPADTVYGIKVALGSRALLDVYAVTGKKKYKAAAIEALDYYSEWFNGDYFAYSDSGHDPYDVPNVSAMLAAQYARAACGEPRFRQIARRAVRHLLRIKRRNHWAYSELTDKPNDAGHAGSIVWGLREAKKNLKMKIPLGGPKRYMKRFLRGKSAREWPKGYERDGEPARLSGAVQTALVLRRKVRIKDYLVRPGVYSMLPGGEVVPVHHAYAALYEAARTNPIYLPIKC